MRGRDGSLVHALRGPITLITVGVLFALNNFTQYRFDQTWPVLLIVFGLLSLLGRAERTSAAAPSIPPGYSPFGFPPPPPPPPDAPAGGYRQSSYTATTPATPPPPEGGPAKGGFGTSAGPKSDSGSGV